MEKRKLSELITIYQLEEELIDLYLEGPSDRNIFDEYVGYKKLERNLYEISDFDFSEIHNKYHDLNLQSNKDKLVALSRELTNNNITAKVSCIVDKDFDGIVCDIENNNFIKYTDFCCLESYFLQENFLNKLCKVGLKNFPIKSNTIISEIKDTLESFFVIRLIKKHFNLNCSNPSIEKSIKVEKKQGKCTLDFNAFINNFININKLTAIKNDILKYATEILKKLTSYDIREKLNGHDLIEILYYYTNKIKNTHSMKIEVFENLVYATMQPNYLEGYDLFKSL